MTVFKPKIDILPENQRKIWPSLKAAADEGFVLYGGTAIALYLGHRTSVDFDFFTDKPIDSGLINRLPFLKKAKLSHRGKNTLIFMVPGKPGEPPVKVSFFGGISFAQQGNIKTTADQVLRVAPIKMLLGTKLKVLFDRIEPKDYIDIAHLLDAGLSLADGLKTAQKMFGNAFSSNEAKKTLIYFDLPDLNELSPAIKQKLIKAVKGVEIN